MNILHHWSKAFDEGLVGFAAFYPKHLRRKLMQLSEHVIKFQKVFASAKPRPLLVLRPSAFRRPWGRLNSVITEEASNPGLQKPD